MRFFVSSLAKDLARWRQDAVAILLWLSIPLIIGGLITSLMDGNGGAKPTGLLLIADQDDSVLSGLVAGAYSQGELGELLVVEKVSTQDGEARIDAGEARAERDRVHQVRQVRMPPALDIRQVEDLQTR